jgi:glutathione S-transferase
MCARLFVIACKRDKLTACDFAGLFRASNVLKHYRGFELSSGPKVRAWFDRLFDHPAFKATCSTEQLYLDSYERFASDLF